LESVDFNALLPHRDVFYIDEATIIPAGGVDGQIVDNLDAMFAQLMVEEVVRRGSW
jgi:hypothetical protein